ncbi:carboxypeptidase-like regulatory domain-containing protein [Catalinimonas niigatensis]|uniref:carboxypeptidase-like regulatory domain-containing protein n=1 Tax=Catalinimonas niigatensis TaxID=1397264 RepID=UPI00266572A6|nr:carboxypeptidase-like regulatory domain-containing protein [Catalinimonas niigatensis]WPP53011.1 carboxypeptidase-like regulatory domain-containing protein [Catalinimonas niigatensis]
MSVQIIQEAHAQAELRKVWGEVKDAQSYEAVSIANISIARQGTYTDLDGHFSFTVKANDTIHITHINYYPYDLMIQDIAQDTLQIFLIPRINTMREVVIRGMPSEEAFKQEMLQLEVKPTIEEIQAKANVNFARQYFLSGYVPQMNSDDNHNWYVAGPQGVTLFSSGPSGGLFRALHNVNRSNRFLKPIRMHQDQGLPDSLWKNVQRQIGMKSNTVEQDSLLSEEN